MKVIQLHLLAHEVAQRHPRSGELKIFRLDFCATMRFFTITWAAYQSAEEVVVELVHKVSLPIISIYILGYVLDEALPMAIRVRRVNRMR